MLAFDLNAEQKFNAERHVENILGKVGEGDVTVACWEPGQVSPNHLHPNATEIYYCVSGGGTMRTPSGDVAVRPGCFVVHPRGELHEYVNGPERTLLFRVRYGEDMSTRSKDWPTNVAFRVKPDDSAFFAKYPDGVVG
jgi:quercetin dioxygenase-like cupin family protein